MTIHIPDDLARHMERIAAAQNKSVEQLAVERLTSFVFQSASPASLLRAIRSLPRPSAGAVDDLEAAITAGRLSVRDQAEFDS